MDPRRTAALLDLFCQAVPQLQIELCCEETASAKSPSQWPFETNPGEKTFTALGREAEGAEVQYGRCGRGSCPIYRVSLSLTQDIR